MGRQFAEEGKTSSQGFSCVEYLDWLFKILSFGVLHIVFQMNKIIFSETREAFGIAILYTKPHPQNFLRDFLNKTHIFYTQLH